MMDGGRKDCRNGVNAIEFRCSLRAGSNRDLRPKFRHSQRLPGPAYDIDE
jgi:hypothetical protein